MRAVSPTTCGRFDRYKNPHVVDSGLGALTDHSSALFQMITNYLVLIDTSISWFHLTLRGFVAAGNSPARWYCSQSMGNIKNI